MRARFLVVDPEAMPLIEACRETLASLGLTACDISHTSTPGHCLGGSLVLEGVGHRHGWCIETKKSLNTDTARLLINAALPQAVARKQRFLVISSYVSDSVATLLHDHDVDFIDAAGNAHLSDPPLLIWFRGAKPRQPAGRVNRAFQASGLQLIALLLAAPDALNWPYRRLAQESGLSLGSISHLLQDLRHTGFITSTADGQHLINRRDLFGKWEFGYASRLRPGLNPQTCRLADNAPIETLTQRAPIGDAPLALGGELAASLMVGTIRPARATIHAPADLPRARVLSQLRLVPDPDGNIEIISNFGRDLLLQAPGSIPRLAHPLLIHAEMMLASTDDRIREAAQHLFEQYLAPELKE